MDELFRGLTHRKQETLREKFYKDLQKRISQLPKEKDKDKSADKADVVVINNKSNNLNGVDEKKEDEKSNADTSSNTNTNTTSNSNTTNSTNSVPSPFAHMNTNGQTVVTHQYVMGMTQFFGELDEFAQHYYYRVRGIKRRPDVRVVATFYYPQAKSDMVYLPLSYFPPSDEVGGDNYFSSLNAFVLIWELIVLLTLSIEDFILRISIHSTTHQPSVINHENRKSIGVLWVSLASKMIAKFEVI